MRRQEASSKSCSWGKMCGQCLSRVQVSFHWPGPSHLQVAFPLHAPTFRAAVSDLERSPTCSLPCPPPRRQLEPGIGMGRGMSTLWSSQALGSSPDPQLDLTGCLSQHQALCWVLEPLSHESWASPASQHLTTDRSRWL